MGWGRVEAEWMLWLQFDNEETAALPNWSKVFLSHGSRFLQICNQRQDKMTYRQRQIKLPAHWPNDVHYLRSCQFHASVTPSLRDFVKGDPSIAGQLSVSYPTCVTIRHITSSAHPANGQCGLFATSHIEPNTRIIDYTGRLSLGRSSLLCWRSYSSRWNTFWWSLYVWLRPLSAPLPRWSQLGDRRSQIW